MGQVTVGAHVYNIGKIDTFQQFDIARLYSPVLAQLGLLERVGEDGTPIPRESVIRAMAVFSRPIPKADSDFIIGACLAVVQRQQPNGTGWAPVRDAMTGKLMYQDISMAEMLEIILCVLEAHKLGEFLHTPCDFGEASSAGVTLASMPDGMDYVMKPVMRGMCRYESLKDGSLLLVDIARMIDAILVEDENSRRLEEARTRGS